MKSADVVIAGGGIIGLSLALEMASTGRKVVVIERGRAMSESSWAAAGMLAARDPENPAALRPISELSLRLYPEYLRRVSDLAGREVPMRTSATLQATRAGEIFAGQAALSGPMTTTLNGRRLDRTQVEGLVEGLVSADRKLDRQFLLLEEQSLDPRDLCNALPLAAKAAGVSIVEDTLVSKLQPGKNGVEVTTTAGLLQAVDFVDCRGAWAGQALHIQVENEDPNTDPATIRPAIKPRKGQMVTVEIADPAQLRVVVRTPDIYLVPRGDGRIVIGATVEDVGFDKAIDHHAVSRLLADARALWPPLQSAPVLAAWAGLRPGTRDDLPIIGLTGSTGPTHRSHCLQAAGHFRNGILLAPATALLLRQLVEGVKPEIALEAFSPRRFLVKQPSLIS